MFDNWADLVDQSPSKDLHDEGTFVTKNIGFHLNLIH